MVKVKDIDFRLVNNKKQQTKRKKNKQKQNNKKKKKREEINYLIKKNTLFNNWDLVTCIEKLNSSIVSTLETNKVSSTPS